MVKSKLKQKLVSTKTYIFYCDECKTYLGEQEERDGGYDDDIGKYEWKYNGGNGWMRKKGNYCLKCREKIEKEIENALLKLGFKKD